MQNFVRYLLARTYRPLLSRYLARVRSHTFRGITLQVPPEVFHPGFFFSTRFLVRYLDGVALNGKTFLELGAGSGLISMLASRRGATVTATDINPVAIRSLHANAQANKTALTIIRSDLFKDVPRQQFDVIAINPPYYKKDPVSHLDHAWYCGRNGAYFDRLFAQLSPYMNECSTVLMVLCDGCDRPMINELARQQGFLLRLVHERRNLVETNFIYQIHMS
jgi:release factor glutamine methyltransferase